MFRNAFNFTENQFFYMHKTYILLTKNNNTAHIRHQNNRTNPELIGYCIFVFFFIWWDAHWIALTEANYQDSCYFNFLLHCIFISFLVYIEFFYIVNRIMANNYLSTLLYLIDFFRIKCWSQNPKGVFDFNICILNMDIKSWLSIFISFYCTSFLWVLFVVFSPMRFLLKKTIISISVIFSPFVTHLMSFYMSLCMRVCLNFEGMNRPTIK